jgi:hypothetical protein
MNLKDAMAQIESDEFFAELAIASDVKLFLKFARQKAPVRSLLRELTSDAAQISVALRIRSLLDREYDPEFLRPWDTALAIYLWALNAVQSPIAKSLAADAASAPNLWWAKQVAHKVGRQEPPRVDAHTVEIVVTDLQQTIHWTTRSIVKAVTTFFAFSQQAEFIDGEIISPMTTDNVISPSRILPGEEKYYRHSGTQTTKVDFREQE